MVTFFIIISALAAVGECLNGSPIEVTLSAMGGSLVEVQITNIGESDINLFQRATILDPNPNRKVDVSTLQGENPPFIGIRARVAHDNLSPESFQLVRRGRSIKTTFDVAEQYDLRSGGPFTIHAHGAIPWAARDSTMLAGAAEYRSNAITITADAAPARRLRKKNALDADCSPAEWNVTQAAVAGCAMLAALAGQLALKGSAAQFARYFGTADQAARELVSRRLMAVSGECAGGATSRSTVRCSDAGRLCRSDYISVTLGGDITNCAIFWRLPLITSTCHGYDQASLMIHETSHVDGVFEPSTVDFVGYYGWPNITWLTPEQAITNADNYQFYANAIYSGKDC